MERSVPPIIHLMNLATLFLIGIILVLAAVDREYQLVIVLPILVTIIVYWHLRTNPQIAASYFGITLAVLFWIIICENIVTIDNTLGTHLTRRLALGIRLLTYVDANLNAAERIHLQPCCDDPMSVHYQPGSTYE